MSKTIVKRKLDGLGRVHIPTRVRKELGLKEGEMLTVEAIGKEIIIYKSDDYCRICGNEAAEKVKDEFICENCIKEIRRLKHEEVKEA